MAHVTVQLSDEELHVLRMYASRRQMPMAELIRGYVAYLLAGGRPVTASPDAGPSPDELAALAEHGGAFDWLGDEPELYGPDDGEPV
jgi:hypothetical protein